MRKFKLLLIIFPLLIIYMFWGTVFWGNRQMMLPLTSIGCFVFIILLYNKWYKDVSPLKYTVLFVLPFVTLLLILSLFFEASFGRSFLYIVLLPLAGLMGYSYLKGYKISSMLGIIALAIIGYTQSSNVFVYFNPPKIDQVKMPTLTFYNEQEKVIELPKDKIVVLDFWISTCSICYTKFPYLEDLKKEYATNKDIFVYSVGVKTKREELNDLKRISDSLGYDYKTIYIKSIDDVRNKLKIDGYPHLLILKNDSIRYDGYPYFEKYVTTSIYSTVDDLLEEY